MVSVKVESLARKVQSHRIIQLSEALMKWDITQPVSRNLMLTGAQTLDIVDADVLCGRTTEGDLDEFFVGENSLKPNEQFWNALQSLPKNKVLSVNTRDELLRLGVTEDMCDAAGIVFFHNDHVRLMLGRQLRSKDVKWGGNPGRYLEDG